MSLSDDRKTASVVVRPLTAADEQAWDVFVFQAEAGTFFHRAGWRQIFEQVFGLKTHFLLAEHGGAIVGILPLVHQRSRLFGNGLISSPFCVECGPLATDPEVLIALDTAAITLMKSERAKFIEYRSRRAARAGWSATINKYATFKKALAPTDDQNLKAIPRKQRAVIRKAMSNKLRATTTLNVDKLFTVLGQSMRNLGTPMYPKSYFKALIRVFSPDCDIVVVHEDNKPVSAVLNFYFRDTVLPYHGGGTLSARRNGANDLLYWEVMREATRRGLRYFDFGRSRADSGAFAFKKNWGFEPNWLEYEYYLGPGASLPNKSPSNPNYEILIRAWKMLPVPLANALGPLLVRNLG